MGLYDRDYYSEEPKKRGPGVSPVAVLIISNIVLYFANQATGNALFEKMALVGVQTSSPFQWYRCLTYAFAHDPNGFMHILCNMLVLFFFGPPLERLYGKAEFTLFYLASAVFGGIVWNVMHFGASAAALGASGAITALVILFAFNFPNVRLLLWGIIPLPAWLAGVLFVLYDMFGSVSAVDNVAHEIHISGAVFAACYFLTKIKLTDIFFGKSAGGKRKSSRSTKSVSSANISVSKSDRDFENLEKEVDDILRKIARSGEASLTEKERDTLRYASQEYQKRSGNKR